MARLKDVISRSGDDVSPSTVKAEIVQRIPTVAHTIVALGCAHALYGEEIGLVVQTGSFNDIRLAIQEVVRSRDLIRRTHTGKIQRRALVPLDLVSR